MDPTRVNEFGFSGEDADKRALGEQGQQQQVDGAEEVPLIEVSICAHSGREWIVGHGFHNAYCTRPIDEYPILWVFWCCHLL